ncbi:hypothetical protein GW755_00935 [bacterium]|nr:hypothetical protein [bacterium]
MNTKFIPVESDLEQQTIHPVHEDLERGYTEGNFWGDCPEEAILNLKSEQPTPPSVGLYPGHKWEINLTRRNDIYRAWWGQCFEGYQECYMQ